MQRVHNPAHPSLGQIAGRMLAGEHDVDEDAQGIDVRTDIRLGQAVLLRSGEAGGTQNLCVGGVFQLVEPGGVEVNEDGIVTSENDIFRLDIPVHGTDGVQHPQCPANLPDDFFRLFRRKEGVLEQKAQSIPLDELLQHQIVPILLGNFVNDGQVGTGVLQQTGIDLCIAGKTAENVKLPRGFVPDGPHTAPGTFFDQPDGLKFRFQSI